MLDFCIYSTLFLKLSFKQFSEFPNKNGDRDEHGISHEYNSVQILNRLHININVGNSNFMSSRIQIKKPIYGNTAKIVAIRVNAQTYK